MTKQAAMNMEKALIAALSPVLNRINNPNYSRSVVSQDEINRWIKLRQDGLSYKDIAETTNFTTMTIWRALNEAN
jgi:DNA invertase Pin-like site-specific DNA recombinase